MATESEMTLMNLPHIAARIFDTPLLICESKLNTILSVLGPKMNLNVPDVDASIYRDGRREHSFQVMDGGIAVIPIYGTLVNRTVGLEAMSGLLSYQTIRQQFTEALNSEDISQIVLDVDSPGGEVNGCFDLAQFIFEARGEKPITAVVNEMAYSAAYALSSAADKIVTPRTGGFGSIGVIAKHVNQSKHDEMMGYEVTTIFAGDRKNDLSPHQPLSDEALEVIEGHVRETYALFVETVAEFRGMSVKAVVDTQAAMYMGKAGVDVGLADEVAAVTTAIDNLVSNERGVIMTGKKDESAVTASTNKQEAAGNVIDFEARVKEAKAEGFAEAQARAKEIDELCSVAKRPDLSGSLIASGMSVEEVSKELLKAKAEQDEQTAVASQNAVESGSAENPLIAAAKRMATEAK